MRAGWRAWEGVIGGVCVPTVRASVCTVAPTGWALVRPTGASGLVCRWRGRMVSGCIVRRPFSLCAEVRRTLMVERCLPRYALVVTGTSTVAGQAARSLFSPASMCRRGQGSDRIDVLL